MCLLVGAVRLNEAPEIRLRAPTPPARVSHASGEGEVMRSVITILPQLAASLRADRLTLGAVHKGHGPGAKLLNGVGRWVGGCIKSGMLSESRTQHGA